MLTKSQKAAFELLRARAEDGRPFTQADLEKAAGWTKSTFTTFKTKHLKEYVNRVGAGQYVIKPQFLRLSEAEYHEIVTQTRTTVPTFVRTVFHEVLKYEFLLPLTNERKLRAALDDLFYRDHCA